MQILIPSLHYQSVSEVAALFWVWLHFPPCPPCVSSESNSSFLSITYTCYPQHVSFLQQWLNLPQTGDLDYILCDFFKNSGIKWVLPSSSTFFAGVPSILQFKELIHPPKECILVWKPSQLCCREHQSLEFWNWAYFQVRIFSGGLSIHFRAFILSTLHY